MSKSECLKQSLLTLRLLYGDLGDVRVMYEFHGSLSKTLSLLCMVRRNMPYELVVLTSSNGNQLDARAPMSME